MWKGTGLISQSVWRGMLRGASVRGIRVEVTIEDAWLLFQQQDGHCALTGVPLNIGPARYGNTGSLDRIDSSLAYVLGNIQWVHKDVNMMKNALTQDSFISWCGKVVAHCQKRIS